MKPVLGFIILMTAAISSAWVNANELATFVQYQKGSPVILHLSYDGGIKDWDAGASISDDNLILTNAMFIAVTDRNDKPVEPFGNRVISVWADAYFRDPFNLVIDISKFYNLARAGKYVLRWGCKDVKEDRIGIEIVDW